MNWLEFKSWSENTFRNRRLERHGGLEIQPSTKWKSGLNETEIAQLEKQFGFEFPTEYKNMLSVINGFDREQIAFDPEDTDDPEYGSHCYRYPDDVKRVQNLLDEILEFRKYADD